MTTASSQDEKDENIACAKNKGTACASGEKPIGAKCDKNAVFCNNKETASSTDEGTACSIDEKTEINNNSVCISEATAFTNSAGSTVRCNDENNERTSEGTASATDQTTACLNDEEIECLNGTIVFTKGEGNACLDTEETASATDLESICANGETTTAGSTDGEATFSNGEKIAYSNYADTASLNDDESACADAEETISSIEQEDICGNDETTTAGSTDGEATDAEGTASSTREEIICANDETTTAGSTDGEATDAEGTKDENTTAGSTDGEKNALSTDRETACSHIERSKPNPAFMKAILGNLLTLTWESQTHKPFTFTPVPPHTLEYDSIRYLFKASAGSYSIRKIERIENPYLLAQYLLKKEKVQNSRGASPEKRLFHGARKLNVESICKTNFDWRRCGRAKFGQGVSFAPEAYYANHYSPDNVMILARVLVNRTTVGNDSTVVPPAPYDTTTNGKDTVYVKYEDDDFYPQYVIHFDRYSLSSLLYSNVIDQIARSLYNLQF